MNGKYGVKYKVTPWGTVGIAFLVALSLSIILSALNVHLILNGAITGLVYNLITKPDLQEEEIKK